MQRSRHVKTPKVLQGHKILVPALFQMRLTTSIHNDMILETLTEIRTGTDFQNTQLQPYLLQSSDHVRTLKVQLEH